MNPEDLPVFITLRALALELCPHGSPLNAFKRQLYRTLKHEGVERRRGAYYLSDLSARVPYLVESWVEVRMRRVA